MKTIIQKAESFINKNGTPFQKSICAMLTGSGTNEQAIAEFNKYQNHDGGWANGLEIEYQGSVSTPFASAEALGYIYKFGLDDGENLNKTITYLKKTQQPDGSWDDTIELEAYEHPPYMGKGIYVEYKTGQNLAWLIRLGTKEPEMIKNAISYMTEVFPKISKRKDFWSAAAYANVFFRYPDHSKSQEIIQWALSVLKPSEEIMWQQAMGMLFDDVIPENQTDKVKQLIRKNQQNDGGFEHPFGTYNAVWLANMIIRFLRK